MIELEDWGLVDYRQALERQMERVAEVIENPQRQLLIACSHPPVVTLGRKTQAEDLLEWTGERVEIQRGGRVTYHGPSQVVVYPIVHLDPPAPRQHLKKRDLHGYLRLLERAVIEVLGAAGLPAQSSPSEEFLHRQGEVEATGVWVGDRKICSIGIGVRKWVTFHGLALNLLKDEQAFRGLQPCGFQREVMVSVEELSDRATAVRTRQILLEMLPGYFV